METSRALIGSSATIEIRVEGERPGDPDPLPLPAAELVREPVRRAGGHAHELEQLPDARRALRARSDGVDVERLPDDGADRHARVEAGVRVLEDHLEALPEPAERLAAERRDLLAVEPDRPGRRVEQPNDRPSGRRLARPGFADQSERSAATRWSG